MSQQVAVPRLERATLRALQAIAIASGGGDPQGVAVLTVESARRLLHTDAGVVFGYDPATRTLNPIYETESPVREPPVRPGQGAIGRAFQTGEPVVIDDYRVWKHAIRASAGRGMVAAIAVPLIAKDRPIGALGVWTYTPRHFKPEEIELLSLFAAQVAPSLEAARLSAERADQAQIFRALHEVAEATSGVKGAAELSRLTASKAQQLLGGDSANLAWWDAEAGHLRPLADTLKSLGTSWTVRPGEGSIGQAYSTRRPVVVEDYPAWRHALDWAVATGEKSVLAVPLTVRDRTVGAMCVRFNHHRSFARADVELLSLLGSQVAPALEAARLLEESESRLRSFQALHEVAVAAGGVLEPAGLAQLMVERVKELLGVDGVMTQWWDESAGLLRTLAHSGLFPEEGAQSFRPGQGVAGLTFELRQPVVVEDYAAWERRLEEWAELNVASAAGVPLLIQDQAVGTLVVWTRQRRRFEPSEIQLLTLLAAQVAPAIAGARVAESRESRAHTLMALHELGVAASGLLDPVALARLTVDRARDLLAADGATLAWQAEGDAKHLAVLANNYPGARPGKIRVGRGAQGRAFATRSPVVVDDYPRWPHRSVEGRRMRVQSALAVPLMVHDRPVGCLGVLTTRTRRFTSDEERLLTLLAAQVAPALESARLVALRESQARIFEVLYDVSVAAGGVLDPSGLARIAVDRARDLLGVGSAFLRWWDPESGRLRLWSGVDPQGTEPAPDLEPGQGVAGTAFSRRAPVVINQYRRSKLALSWALKNGIVAALSVPLLVGKRAVGVLSVGSYERRQFDANHVRLLSLFAAQVAPALEAARLAEERQRQARIFRTLHDLAVAAGGVLEPDKLAQLAVERARVLLGSERATLVLADPAGGGLRKLAESDEHGGSPEEVPIGEGIVGIAYQEARPLAVEDYQGWEHALPWTRAHGFQSGLGVPLLAHDRSVGAIAVLTKSRRAFGAAETQLLSLLAAQVAPAIEAARLHTDLEESEARKSAILESSLDCVVAMDSQGRIVEFNPAAEKVFGHRREDVLGRPIAGLLIGSAGDGQHSDLQRYLESAEMQTLGRRLEITGHRADGTQFPLEIAISAFEQGGERMFSASLRDLTERVQAEAAGRESEGRFRVVFERSAIGIARIDLRGRLIEANPALHAMLGYGPGELVGAWIGSIVHPDDRDAERFRDLTAGRVDETQLELRYLHQHQVAVWGNTIGSLVLGADGQPSFVIAMIEDITVRKVQEAALEHRALHDALTDLPNRSLLLDRLHQAVLAGQREQEQVALLMMDLDGFKDVNDAFGHHAGDALLQQVALRLRAELRGSDTVARLGGDEFAVVLPGVLGHTGAVLAARKLLKSLEPLFMVEGEALEVGASLGIALFPDHGDDAETLMRRADVAMYVAKRTHSGFAIYGAEQDTDSPNRLALTAELRQALDRGELTVHFQPKYDLAKGTVVGAEALARWSHPRLGLLLPEQFVHLAEQSGLIRRLGMMVLEQSIRQSRQLGTRVAVNLSMRNLQDPQLPDTVRDLLERYETPAGNLQVELTESTLMADPRLAAEVLNRLDGMGVRVAIDDFGTGYSSLVHLRRLPLREVKIDKSFVLGMLTQENDAVIVRSIIELAHNLGLEVVGEGVENQATEDLLRKWGCDLAQGFHFGRPLPAAEFKRFVRSSSGRH
ncbi:MAG TPA: GAF domain-containing protein [Candidatus Acidoferrales bacterium]|nr:GAF domain-containing protein [Candidatus Acidoferrales bacterium]